MVKRCKATSKLHLYALKLLAVDINYFVLCTIMGEYVGPNKVFTTKQSQVIQLISFVKYCEDTEFYQKQV